MYEPRSTVKGVPLIVLVTVVLFTAGCGGDDGTNDAISIESTKTVKKSVKTPAEKQLGNPVANLPDTGLVDQSGNPFSFADRSGSPFLLSFVFTRCPDPGMCPLVTQKMQRIGRTEPARDLGLELVAVTIDPDYDTPAVLRTYASQRKLKTGRWHLVTGPLETINLLTDTLQVSVLRGENQTRSIKTHNMRTYLVDADGVLRDVWTGSDWELSTVKERLRALREGSS